MTLVHIHEFENPDWNIDWTRYRAAQKANGEVCSTCGACILFESGHPQKCQSCRDLESAKEETTHATRARCPSCGHVFNVWDMFTDSGALPSDESMAVDCPECDKTFEVGICIEYSFTSPAVGKERGL